MQQNSFGADGDIRAILNSSIGSYILFDREYCIISFNDRAGKSFERIFDKTLQVGDNIRRYYTSGITERFEQSLDKAFKGEVIESNEKLNYKGRSAWYIQRFSPVYNGEEINAVSFHAIDITVFKKDFQHLNNERKLFEQGPAVAFKWTPFREKSITHFVSPNVESIFGYKPDFLIGKSFFDFIHPQDIKRLEDYINTNTAQKLRSGEQSYVDSSYRVLCKDGSFKWVNDYSFLAKEIDGKELVYGYLIDITEEKEAKNALEQKNKALQEALTYAEVQSKIIEVTTNIIMLTDKNGLVTWVNEAFEKTTGYNLEEIVGKTAGELLRGKDTDRDTIARIEKIVEQERKETVEILNYKKSGEEFWLEIVIEPIYDEAGNLSAYLSIQNDITPRKVIEKQLADRDEQLKKFSFITSHELRHEFAKIMLLLENKEILLQNSDDELSILNEIETAAKQMNDIISKMNMQLHVSQTPDSEYKQLSLADVDEICLVDDDDIVCFINKKLISMVLPGKKVVEFNNVDNALAHLKDSPAATKRYIFLDLNMPIKTGWHFLEEYKLYPQHSPVVILTSSIEDSERERSKNYPQVISFLTKPLTKDKLESFIR